MLGRDVKGSTVGIIGLGGIGETIVERLKGFNIKKFVYSGRSEKPEGSYLKYIKFSIYNLIAQFYLKLENSVSLM